MENSRDAREPSFAHVFRQISPEEIADNVFTLVGKDFYAITVGKKDHYNSMAASGGGLGVHLMKPTTWCTLRTSRYTLELLRQEQTYTLSYFPDEYKKQLLLLGSKSGRDSEKMKETELTALQTLSGNMSFREARMVIECRLMEITTPSLEDFYSAEARAFVEEAYKEPDDYRRLVFGEITQVWVKS